jgi:hypothetical protein
MGTCTWSGAEEIELARSKLTSNDDIAADPILGGRVLDDGIRDFGSRASDLTEDVRRDGYTSSSEAFARAIEERVDDS